MTKTLNQIIFFPPPKSEYFFQQHWEWEYCFRKKNIPPFKLNVVPLVWTNSPRVDMSLHPDTLYWSRVDQSLLLLLNGTFKCQFIVSVFNYPIVARTHNLPHSRLECYILPQRCGLENLSQLLSVWFYDHIYVVMII
jgi:hypothetical protein